VKPLPHASTPTARRRLAAFRFPPAVLKAIRQRAARRGLSQSDYLSRLVAADGGARATPLPR
jgi:predicted DNA binding CopG/RHH family protein